MIRASRFADRRCGRRRSTPRCVAARRDARSSASSARRHRGLAGARAAVPLIALDSPSGGASQDPADKPGVANMVGRCSTRAPATSTPRPSRSGWRARRSSWLPADRDHFRGSLRTLDSNRDEAFDLLRLALTAPRFDAEAVERIRARSCRGLRARDHQARTTSPAALVGDGLPGPSLWPADQRHARDRLPRSRADDLRDLRRAGVRARHLKIAIVGDIDAATAGKLLDRVFGALPAKATLRRCRDAHDAGPRPAHRGRARRAADRGHASAAPASRASDPDFMAAYVRQPHPRRRLVLLAALSRGAREARARLRRRHHR